MTHVDEGLLVAVRDRAADGGDGALARAHLEGCATCRDALADLATRARDVTEALRRLDRRFDLGAARAAVRARVTAAAAAASGGVPIVAGTSPTLPGASRRRWVPRAAASVVFLAAATAAAALPGSPVRGWIRGLLSPATQGPMPATAPAAPPATAAPAVAESTGVRLDAAEGPLRVILKGAAHESAIEVRWVSGTEAAVFAPVGSRFTSAQGRLEAVLVPGPVRVELPRGVTPTALEVDGRVYLLRRADGVDITGPVLRRDADGVVFRTPSR
jgi:hypothetical protein